MQTGQMLGGGVVVALAAGLWLIYLVPTWLRRREYVATERNAVRLQQTLRILAESAEVPDAIHVEANARQIAHQQRLLRKVQQRAAAEAKTRAQALARAEEKSLAEQRAREEAEARQVAAQQAEERAWAEAEARARAAARQAKIDAAVRAARVAGVTNPKDSAASKALRRGRLLASALLLAGVVTAGVAIAAGVVVLPLVLGIAAAVAGLWTLGRLASRTAAARAKTVAVRRAHGGRLYDDADHDEIAAAIEADAAAQADPSWTPRPLPKALHLSRGTKAATTMASLSAAEELRRAAEREALEERAARQRPKVPRILPPVPAVPAAAGADAARPGAAAAGQQAAAEVSAAARAALLAQAQAQTARAVAGGDSRYARMGVVGDVEAGSLNLDEALRRRRAV